MLYVFRVVDSQYIKFGWAERKNPYDRIINGFWTNDHPDELCGRLGAENLELIYLFEGDQKLERVIQSLFPPDRGEFWKEEDSDEMINMLKLIAKEIPVPRRPIIRQGLSEKLACCTGIWNDCFTCGMKLKIFCKLLQHKRDVHENAKFRCACGKMFPRKGNLHRHVLKSCTTKS